MNYGDLVNKIIDLIKWAIGKYNISCIVIDCGPIIDPYTAAAAHIADRAFIIGQNEPISYQSLKNYTNKISEFYDEFKSSKMGIIINKVRAADRVPPDVFLSIPFTMEVIDISEGIEDINQIRLSLFNSYIQQIIYEVFQNNKMLIPPKEVALNSELRDLEKDIDKLYKHKEIKFFKHSKISSILFMSIIILGIGFKFYYAKINPFSIHGMNLNSSLNSSLNQALIRDPNMLFNLVIILGIIGFFISYIISKRYSDNLFIINNIKDGGADYIASMLQSKDGRAKLEKIRTMMKRVQDKRIESNENQSAND